MRRALFAKFLLWTGFAASYAVGISESIERSVECTLMIESIRDIFRDTFHY